MYRVQVLDEKTMLNPIKFNPYTFVPNPAFGQKERVMIIDDFKGYIPKNAPERPIPEGALDINSDGIPELWHGYMVKGALLSAGNHKDLPEIEEQQDKNDIHNLNKIIKKIIKRNNDDNPDNDVHMANFSGGISCTYTKASNEIGEKITPENIHEKKEKIIPKFDFKYLTLGKFLSNLTKTTEKTKFYISTTWLPKSFFNFYSFADGVKTIGGLDKRGKRYAKTSLTDTNNWAPMYFTGELLQKDGKPYGYDVAPFGQKGDGEIDILLSDIKLSGNNPPDRKIELDGVSFSTPYKLAKDYLARQAGKEEWNPFEDS